MAKLKINGLRMGLYLILLLGITLPIQAQKDSLLQYNTSIPEGENPKVRVMTSVEPNHILVGQQAKLRIKVAYPKGSKLAIYLPKDTLVTGVEWLNRPQLVDSAEITSELDSKSYEVPITSFDSASYKLEHISAIVDGALYKPDEAPNFSVTNIPVNISKPNDYKPNKPIWKVPFLWSDYLWILYTVLGLILLFVFAYFIYRYALKRNKRKTGMVVEHIDPYEEAKKELEAIKEEELWKKGEVKKHYTLLTDTLRLYLHRLLAIYTLDKTSNEIIEQLKHKREISKTEIETLQSLFEEADLVKFAKYLPREEENLKALSKTSNIIDSIKASHEEELNRLKIETEKLQNEKLRNTPHQESSSSKDIEG